MIYKMFTIYDSCADAHLPPFILPKEEQAKRTFYDCVNSEDHQFGQHPDHYTLMEIASFDDEIGLIRPLEVPISHGNGVVFRKPPTQEESTDGTQEQEPQISNGAHLQPDT